MNKSLKNGFTLSEILAVIVILALILIIAIPSVLYIRKRMNDRVFEAKKEVILAAAELYARDKSELLFTDSVSETLIPVGELVRVMYIEPDVVMNPVNCYSNMHGGYAYSYGCVIDPREKESINNQEILLKKKGTTYEAYWGGYIVSVGEDALDVVCSMLNSQLEEGIINCNCGTINNNNSYCLLAGKDVNNYLRYSGKIWRILGVYNVDGDLHVKMITDYNIDTNNNS